MISFQSIVVYHDVETPSEQPSLCILRVPQVLLTCGQRHLFYLGVPL